MVLIERRRVARSIASPICSNTTVARIERSEIRDRRRHAVLPGFAALNPGYTATRLT